MIRAESPGEVLSTQSASPTGDHEFDEDGFNDRELLVMREQSVGAVFASWKRERGEFIAAVEDLPFDQFSAEFLYPWGGEYGNVSTIVGYMTGHDLEHRVEIEKALEE